MRKKNNLAFYALIIVGLFSLFAVNNFAQTTDSAKTEQKTKTCSGEKFVMPPSIAVGNDAFGDYLKVASLPQDERGSLWSKQSNEQKANFIKVNLALQFVKRPEMTNEQKEFVLDAISSVSADIYDKTDAEKTSRTRQNVTELENRAIGLFNRKDLGDFIEPLMTNKDEEVGLLQKYEEILSLPMTERKEKIRNASPTEKSDFWKSQLVYHLAVSNFSQNQKLFIIGVIPLMSSSSFSLPLSEGQIKNEETRVVQNYMSRASEFFTKTEIYTVFMGYGIHKMIPDKSSTTENRSIRHCDCNNLCGISSSCNNRASCAISRDGCGWFGYDECENLCVSDN